MLGASHHLRRLSPCAAIVVLCAACDSATPENIARWKGTERGPGKLRKALANGSVAPELRAQALAALVELGMLSDAQSDLANVPDGERRALLHAAVPLLKKLAETPGSSSKVPEGGTTRVQREAKDALFVVREHAAPEDRVLIDATLVDWLCVDLAGRMSAGGQGGEKILETVGAPAAGRLADLVADERTPAGSLMAAAQVLGKMGDAKARARAGAALAERARREKNQQESTLQQIGLVGGDLGVAYLTQLAEDGRQPAVVRQKALLSLAQRGDPATLDAALRIAGDAKAPGKVREAAFQAAEKVGGVAVPGLVKLLDDKDDLVRWRAVEAALGAGKAEAIVPVLEGLPQARSYSKEDVRSYVVHDIMKMGAPALPPLRQALKSKSWVARAAAVAAIAEIGKADDAAEVASLGSDPWKLKGWPQGATIGSEARAAAAELRKKN